MCATNSYCMISPGYTRGCKARKPKKKLIWKIKRIHFAKNFTQYLTHVSSWFYYLIAFMLLKYLWLFQAQERHTQRQDWYRRFFPHLLLQRYRPGYWKQWFHKKQWLHSFLRYIGNKTLLWISEGYIPPGRVSTWSKCSWVQEIKISLSVLHGPDLNLS